MAYHRIKSNKATENFSHLNTFILYKLLRESLLIAWPHNHPRPHCPSLFSLLCQLQNTERKGSWKSDYFSSNFLSSLCVFLLFPLPKSHQDSLLLPLFNQKMSTFLWHLKATSFIRQTTSLKFLTTSIIIQIVIRPFSRGICLMTNIGVVPRIMLLSLYTLVMKETLNGLLKTLVSCLKLLPILKPS